MGGSLSFVRVGALETGSSSLNGTYLQGVKLIKNNLFLNSISPPSNIVSSEVEELGIIIFYTVNNKILIVNPIPILSPTSQRKKVSGSYNTSIRGSTSSIFLIKSGSMMKVIRTFTFSDMAQVVIEWRIKLFARVM
jgi:hypothetical protein